MITSNTYYRYLRLGLTVRPVRGRFVTQDKEQEFAFSYPVEDVQYVLNDFGEFEETGDSTSLLTGVRNLELIVNSSRHEIVQKILAFIRKHAREDVDLWCQVGSEPQLQILFGDDAGLIAQLVMDFSSEEKFEEYKQKIIQSLIQLGVDEDDMPDIADIEEFVLIPANDDHVELFNTINIPGVIVEQFDEDDYHNDEDEED